MVEEANRQPEPVETLYHGCHGGLGHCLYRTDFGTVAPVKLRDYPTCPWTEIHMDSGLLFNGERDDNYDGKVWWTCGGRDILWFAFFWWDRSVDKRANSNSFFGVKMTNGDLMNQNNIWKWAKVAFAAACKEWPEVVIRQKQPLVLQEK